MMAQKLYLSYYQEVKHQSGTSGIVNSLKPGPKGHGDSLHPQKQHIYIHTLKVNVHTKINETKPIKTQKNRIRGV